MNTRRVQQSNGVPPHMEVLPVTIDTTQPNPARRYNYWLGGKDNFAADRTSGDAIAAAFPHIVTAAVENRRFLERAVSCLAGELGIRQFLDVGTGIPTRPFLHEIAGRHHADARTVYVDKDPFVVVHARALMTAQPPAAVGYLHADLRRPHTITSAADLSAILDLSEPVGVLLVAVLHFLADVDRPAAVVAELVDALPVGSHVVMSHATFDSIPEPVAGALGALADPEAGHGPFHARSRHQVCELITGLDPVGPGLVPITEWRPDLAPGPCAGFAEAAFYGVAACKR